MHSQSPSSMPVGVSFEASRSTKPNESVSRCRGSTCVFDSGVPFCGASIRSLSKFALLTVEGCNRTLDRDFNAAGMAPKRGLAQVGQDMPELKPVETGPLTRPDNGTRKPRR